MYSNDSLNIDAVGIHSGRVLMDSMEDMMSSIAVLMTRLIGSRSISATIRQIVSFINAWS